MLRIETKLDVEICQKFVVKCSDDSMIFIASFLIHNLKPSAYKSFQTSYLISRFVSFAARFLPRFA